MSLCKNVVILLMLSSCLEYRTSGELFTALVDLEKVLYAEREVAEDLRSYIQREQTRLNKLSRVADDFEHHSQEALVNPERHLSNPVNAFQLVKRFTTDWEFVMENYIRNNASEEFLERLLSRTNSFPDHEDLSGAAVALLRLQDTYALPTDKVARGDIQGVKNSPRMTANDCYELGRIAYNDGDFYHTVLWMQEAFKLTRMENPPSIPIPVILDYLSYSTYKQGNTAEALRLTIELLLLDPDHIRGQRNKRYYEELLSVEGHKEPPALKNERPFDGYKSSSEFTTYERLCRGENTHFHKDSHKLTCQYVRHHPMFYINPLREEVVFLKPRIVIFRDCLSDKEMNKVKELATPRLRRATVQNSETGQLETANYRVSKSGWLKDEDDSLILQISQRARRLANLTLDTVEELQVVNYGIGGHYEPHYDFARKQEKNAFEPWRGNRIMTFICYMTDVEAGGATVFPEIGVRLLPSKGSCAVWYNLQKNGEGDYDTRHAACPVLTGSKWVCNKWFHERGQEFIRPCSLSPDE